jgi:S-adenosyl methyltransferase
MTGLQRRVAHRIDVDAPHPARMHDYWLGGRHNFAADRELAEKIAKAMPGIGDLAWLNQRFLCRATLFLVESGVRQFLDIGSGSLAAGAVHEIVQQVDPGSRIVYVDSDPLSVAHRELMLHDQDGAAVIDADVRDIDGILGSDTVTRLLDLDRPIALIAPMLHFVPDKWDPGLIIAGYRDRLASGSYLTLVHVNADANVPGLPAVIEAYRLTRYYSIFPRSYSEILALCTGFDLVPPGLVGLADWRPDQADEFSASTEVYSLLSAAVGRKP